MAAARAAEVEGLRAGLEAEREVRRRLELRLAELERRLGMNSTDSGMPSSKERIGAKEARRARQQCERERRKDRKRGGQPGHHGKGLKRNPDPDDTQTAGRPAECRRSCGASLDGAATFAEPPPGLHPGAVCYGPVLNVAAVLLSCYGNVSAERTAHLIGMLLDTDVSPGWVDKAVARLNARCRRVGSMTR